MFKESYASMFYAALSGQHDHAYYILASPHT